MKIKLYLYGRRFYIDVDGELYEYVRNVKEIPQYRIENLVMLGEISSNVKMPAPFKTRKKGF